MTWIRALAAAILSLVLPGAGHALIRDWVRALLFAGLFLSAVALIMPVGELTSAGSPSDVISIVTAESRTNQFVLSFMLLFAAVDAGFRAMGFPPGSNATNEGPVCPNCGRELDTEIEFCHWCTVRLEYPDPESDAEVAGDVDASSETDAGGETERETNTKPETETDFDPKNPSNTEPETDPETASEDENGDEMDAESEHEQESEPEPEPRSR